MGVCTSMKRGAEMLTPRLARLWRRATPLLLLLGFTLGQSLAVVHATQHEIAGGADSAYCQTCAVAHAGGGAPATFALAVGLAPSSHHPVAVPVAAISRDARLRPPGRAPPLSLC